MLKVISDYTYGLDILDQYDHQELKKIGTSSKNSIELYYTEAIEAINIMKNKFGGSSLFAQEKDKSFEGSINAIYQSFSGKELYPTLEEKATHLLYFITKNHSFVDGNKRIVAFLFILFLDKNKILYRKDGSKRIADNALVALTLMIAESRPEDKEMMIKVIVNLINDKN